MMKFLLALPFVLSMASPAVAQTVSECDWQAGAQSIMEPWDDHTKTFAEGAVRLAVLDTLEPAAAAMHLLVLSPPFDEVGGRQCKTIGSGDKVGFSGIRWNALSTKYDPNAGLIFEVPVSRYDPASGGFPTGLLSFTLNQTTGKIDAVVLDDTR
jgi:hypothetical protein